MINNNLLKINKKILYKYRRYVRDNEDKSILEVRKLLTRNFILGREIWTDNTNNIQARMYGNLKIIVDMDSFEVRNIYNNVGKKRRIYINQLEKENLNKIFKIVA